MAEKETASIESLVDEDAAEDLNRAIQTRSSKSRPFYPPLFLQARIAAYTGLSKATVSRVLRRAGMSKLTDPSPKEDVRRDERDAPGELLHIVIKKLGRFDKVGHRVTVDRTQRARDIGWDHVFVAVDDHSRVASTQIYPDETKQSAESFLRASVSFSERLNVPIQRVIIDNGKCFHSALFGAACLELGIAQKFTRAYRPQTNGKAERFVQSVLRLPGSTEMAHMSCEADERQGRREPFLWDWHFPPQ